MISVQKLLFLLIFFNISVLIGFHLIGRHNIANITTDDLGLFDDWPGQDAPPLTKQDTKIENPFKLLGAYEKVDPVYFNRGDEPEELYKKITYGLINDDDYCDKVDMYYLAHPEKMMQNKNFFTDYPWKTVPRIAIEKAGTVSMTHISNLMAKKAAGKSQYHLDTTINNFYTIMGGFHQHHEINKHFLCQTQMYNHIPGNGVMYRKDLVLDKILAYKQKFQDRPECFNQSEFFLPFYRLFKKEECQAFFEIINSDDYKVALEKTPVQYLIKQGHGAHKSTGVFLLDEDETTLLMEKYQNGLRCGEETESLIAQKYITNPLLLDKQNKFDFRIYMLIASTNPAIVYYHDGYLRVSVETFDMNSKDRGTHLTNTYLAEKKFAEARKENKTINGMTAKEMEEYHLWDFAKFQDYLLASGKITDKNWLDNYLRPQFKKAFTHLIKMSSDGFWKQSNVYELHGLDFMLDDDMNLWFIESNPNPLLIGVKPNLISQMLADMFEIQYAYYRSRMKRLVGLIRWMQDEAEEVGRDGLDLDMWKEEYALAVKNKLEPEYRLKAANTFMLVMDESKPKEEAYLGRIPGECFSE